MVLTLLFVACGTSRSTLATLTSTFGNAAAMLAALQGSNSLGDSLRQQTQLAVDAINSWREGTPTEHVVQAINLVIDSVTLICPENGGAACQYRPLVVLVLGTAAHIIDLINSKSGTANPPHTMVRIAGPPENAGRFKQIWDDIRAGSDQLQKAPVL